ncbi:MAG TPA: AraC family transcriptional regulator [Bacteroidales bacterium]|jgi:AraC-like DNA-binding protein|nr:AraC family transcriptional regulator [Bacteroidales bacterium]
MIAGLEELNFDDSGGFRIEYVTDINGFWHFHPEYEITLNTKSNGTRIVGDSVEIFDEYDLVLIGENIPHCWNYYRKTPFTGENQGIMLHFKLCSIGESLLSQHELTPVKNLLLESKRGIVFSVEDAKMVEPFLKEMTRTKGLEKMINFFHVLKILSDSERKTALCSENYRHSHDERGNRKMTDVYTFVRDNFHKPVSLEKVSKIAHMSPFAFSRFFKKNSGTGFIEYLNKVRMKKACHLLRETRYQIRQVATECGFSSISNFNKQFRKTEGVSPKAYRAQFL